MRADEQLAIRLALLDKLTKGCEGVRVIDARKHLNVDIGPLAGRRDKLKPKVLYLCSDQDADRVVSFVQRAIDEAHRSLPNTAKLVYNVKHVRNVHDVILSGSEAHLVKTYTGSQLSALLKDIEDIIKETSTAQDVLVNQILKEIEAFLPLIVPDQTYRWRNRTGTAYRVTCFTGSERCQYSVGNVLILSGPDEPSFSIAAPRKRRSDIFDETHTSLLSFADVYLIE